MDSNGLLAVKCGSPPSSHGVLLFLPVDGAELEVDPHVLAQTLAHKQLSVPHGVLARSVDVLEPEEAIVVCLDVSFSMTQAADPREVPLQLQDAGSSSQHPHALPSSVWAPPGLLLATQHHWGCGGGVPHHPPWTHPPTNPPLKDSTKVSSGPLANQKFSPAPLAPIR